MTTSRSANSAKTTKAIDKGTIKFKNINFYDIINLTKPKSTAQKDTIEKIEKIYNNIMVLKNILSENHGNLEYDTKFFNEYYEKIYSKQYDDIRKKMLFSDGVLINTFKQKYIKERYYDRWGMMQDDIGDVSEHPCILGKNVKDIVEKFMFVLMPWSCADPSIRELQGTPNKAIDDFVKECTVVGYNVYVISPIGFYSLRKHLDKNTENLGIYAGHHTILVNSITINIPIFRNIETRINKVEDEIKQMRSTMSQFQIQLTSMQNQMHELLQRQLQQEIQFNAKIREQTALYNQLKQEVEVIKCLLDPILIAVPEGIDVNSTEFNDTICKVGPCWGPDFTEAVSMCLGLNVITGQRKMLNAHFNIFQQN